MQHIFGEHIGPTVEAYVDDIIVKTKKGDNLVNDFNIAFKCLRVKNIKLNPKKCVFGVPRGMLLGFIMSKHGIEANLEKITAITKMGPIRYLKGVQRVTGCLAALGRFISRLGKKALPMYRLLKNRNTSHGPSRPKKRLRNSKLRSLTRRSSSLQLLGNRSYFMSS
jgi:hypothetical protein